MTDDNLRLHADDAVLTVHPDTGRIEGLRLRETELLRSGDHFGSFPMAPWCGRMRDGILHWNGRDHQLPRNAEPHAIHGTVRDHPWEVVRHNTTELVLTQDLRAPWPFPGRVTQSFELTPESVELRMTVEATGEPFPAQLGWHPWFHRRLTPDGKDVEISFTPAWQERRGPDHLPDGTRIPPGPGPWDDCFGMPDGVHVVLTWPGAVELTIASPLQWVVVYDEPAETVCVEPQSGPPDGLNTLPQVVAPDRPLTGSTRWSWRYPD
ncbi:aldose 1-epimerase [Nocardia sp. ET3-3]|uniref:Aldose 1-epimerase n=1 Tax=Nocardia terrae TaxID=2675851 RepID=A0A7K1V0X4_9NOCA|nr:aldose 1-epimerase [Nocardia terrae]MVU80290.1 aldose 1-epimerase [Nocardia terrae]